MNRVALYSRVSTLDKGQDAENQLAQLRAWAGASGHTIVAEYADHVSGSKGERQRPGFARMLTDAHKRRFDVVAVWALDRLTREGMAAAIAYMQRLNAAGVHFYSYSEPALSTHGKDDLTRNVLLTVMAELAKVERVRISERTKAGLDRVRAKGTRLGRPTLGDGVQAKIAGLARENADMTAYAIAKAVGCDVKTAAKYAGAARAA
jgi:DNA invertase Pin-like site-specific DNA recombinase